MFCRFLEFNSENANNKMHDIAIKLKWMELETRNSKLDAKYTELLNL